MIDKVIENTACRLGFGKKVTRQKIIFSNDELSKLMMIQSTYQLILEKINIDFIDKQSKSQLKQRILVDLIGKKDVAFVSVFCPSYKNGSGSIGYNKTVGANTKHNIDDLIEIKRLFNTAGCKVSVVIYFSDLLIENYKKLEGTTFRQDLSNNLNSLIDYSPDDFKIVRLSALDRLDEIIGEEGSSRRLMPENTAGENIVKLRNGLFYEQLGWSDREIKDRSLTLAINYPYIAQSLDKIHADSYLYWSESAFERYLLMPNLKMIILFPKKRLMANGKNIIFKNLNIKNSYTDGCQQSFNLIIQCIDKNQVVFEQEPAYFFNYLAFGMTPLVVETQKGNILPIIISEPDIIFAYPKINDWAELSHLVRQIGFNDKSVTFRYYGEDQSADYEKEFKNLSFKKVIRSKNELFYSVSLLKNMPGKQFSRLRNKRNTMYKSANFRLDPMSLTSINDIKMVINQWNRLRLHVYKKDKRAKELNYIINTLKNRSANIKGYILYYKNDPVGIMSLDIRKAKKTICITILKGINNISSQRITPSDYLYLSAFKIADDLKLDFINDGDEGLEPGTISHKRSFNPILSRRTYDYVINSPKAN